MFILYHRGRFRVNLASSTIVHPRFSMPYAEKQDGLGVRVGLVMLQLCNPDLLVG